MGDFAAAAQVPQAKAIMAINEQTFAAGIVSQRVFHTLLPAYIAVVSQETKF